MLQGQPNPTPPGKVFKRNILLAALGSALYVACSQSGGAAGGGGAAGLPGAAGGQSGSGGGLTAQGGDVAKAGAGGSAGGSGSQMTGGQTAGTAAAGAGGGGAASAGMAGSAASGGLGTAGSDGFTRWTVTSPSNLVRGTVELTDKSGVADYPAGLTRLFYRVEVGGPADYAEVLADSPLGITRSDQDFVDGLIFDSAGEESVVDDTYTLYSGKRSSVRNPARERLLNFRTGSGSRLQLAIRAYDDGFAFRYRFPETSDAMRTVTGEATGFRLPAGSRGFLLPYDVAGMYQPAYEAYWQSDVAVGTAAPAAAVGWCFPALFRTPSNRWVLLTEADLEGTYFGAHLGSPSAELVYRIALPAAAEANATGVVTPSSTLPWHTPWRVVIAGTSLRPIVESTLTTDLAKPAANADWSWVKPGRVSWSWWSDDTSPTDYNRLLPFVDLAASMGWEYSLVDANWHMMTNGTWQGLATYATSKNVGLFLWYGSGGAHNSILQYGPRDLMDDPERRRAEFQTISQAGIKGVKVDFFLSDKPWMMQYYLDILQDAAENKLLVNFHGATLPRGWQRTYPNLLTMEAVRGAEEYKYSEPYPAGQPARNTILPFTRNVVGSMDFTPVTFTDAMYPHVTTNAHELALSVVFESGLQHFADRVSGYQSLPAAPQAFLKQVPASWDETRFLDGSPGNWLTLARRKGTVWYVAGISGEAQMRSMPVPLAFLGAGQFSATLISDGDSDRTFGGQTSTLSATDTLTVAVRARGGFVARLEPATAP